MHRETRGLFQRSLWWLWKLQGPVEGTEFDAPSLHETKLRYDVFSYDFGFLCSTYYQRLYTYFSLLRTI